MNWEAVAAIAEAVGALAVVASLIYLALQIRQNNASVKASTYASGLSQATYFTGLLLSNESLGSVWARGLTALAELDTADRLRFDALMLRFFRMFESYHRQTAGGLLDADLFDVGWKECLQHAGRPGAIAWWQANRQLFTTAFREFVDRELGARA